jgi:HK97 family phage portal protein
MNFNIFKRNNTEVPPPQPDMDGGAMGLSFLKNHSNMNMTSLSAVFCAVEKISNSIGQLPIHIKTKRDGKIQYNHPLNTVIESCNMTKFMLIKMLVTDALLYGDGIAYIERAIDGTPTNIVYYQKGTFSTFYNEKDHSIRYKLNNINGQVEDCDVIHVYKNSKNGLQGIGFMEYASRTIQALNSTENAAKSFFDSGMKLDGMLKSTQKLSEKQKADIRQAWNQVHSTNNNGLVILGCDMDYSTIGQNANESQLLETRLFNVSEVARFFQISPVLLQDLTKSSYSTIEASTLDFLIHTLTPFIKMLDEELSRKLLKPSERQLYTVEMCTDEFLVSDKTATSSYLSTLVNAGIITRNEARHMIKMQPIEGGDDLIVAYTDIKQNTIGNKTDNTDKNTEKN